ncbi:uncharacterized protein B0H18DRAFT_229032 [Fomitopsis serialis]|uniref:uncharacterized protein n=1 Tax=Fomitopsis serialis TaxID=139415 RepID=UPI0020073AAD|nr:uncharacterized protein B0H18DRAFT_229032 [Neoantrodia serialis]KAH9912740.1 hypothetical protein B0H18DRAFT_229032 [Neoantrodia serialis]
MIEDDAEVLDWGHEDDKQTAQHGPEDVEDAVSLGGDEDDMQDCYPYQATEQEVAAQPPILIRRLMASENRMARSSWGATSQSGFAPPATFSVCRQAHSCTSPEPALSVAPVHPSPAQASTLASSMIQREPRTNDLGMPVSGSNHDALPSDWELRQARSGGGEQYYNTKTHESTWTQPVSGKSSPAKDKERGVSRGREGVSPSRRVILPERRMRHKESKRAAHDLVRRSTLSSCYDSWWCWWHGAERQTRRSDSPLASASCVRRLVRSAISTSVARAASHTVVVPTCSLGLPKRGAVWAFAQRANTSEGAGARLGRRTTWQPFVSHFDELGPSASPQSCPWSAGPHGLRRLSSKRILDRIATGRPWLHPTSH